MLKHCENQIVSEADNSVPKAPNKSKHRRNQSIFTSSEQNSFGLEHDEVNQRIIQTIKKSQAQPSQVKVQYVDDFAEDINSLAQKIDLEHQKESFRNQFYVAQDLKNKQLGHFLKDYDINHPHMEEIQEEVEEQNNK